MKSPTISGLKSDLRCANAEAKDYLERLSACEGRLQIALEEKEAERNESAWKGRLCGLLMRALEEAYARADKR